MPWTKLNYPKAMKNLAAGTRTKAIQIANAILKENKKMKEGVVIATAIKQAEAMAAKPKVKKADSKSTVTKKKAGAKKVKKVAAKSKAKATTRTKSAVAKKSKATKRAVTTKAKTASKVKSKPQAKKKVAATATKKVDKKAKKVATSIRKVAGSISRQKSSTNRSIENERKSVVQPVQSNNNDKVEHIDVPLTQVLHGENLHFIPEKGDGKPISTFESHQIQNVLHKREEVAYHQENQKVSQALSSRKNDKRTYRHKGGR